MQRRVKCCHTTKRKHELHFKNQCCPIKITDRTSAWTRQCANPNGHRRRRRPDWGAEKGDGEEEPRGEAAAADGGILCLREGGEGEYEAMRPGTGVCWEPWNRPLYLHEPMVFGACNCLAIGGGGGGSPHLFLFEASHF